MNLSQRLLLVFLFASLFDNVQKLRAQPGRGPSTVVVSRVISSKMASSMDFIGTVTPIQNSIIGSAVDGRVESVLADEGDPVFKAGSKDPLIAKTGQPLMQMRTGTLQIEIDAAEILLNTRKDALDELKTSLPSDIEQATATVEDYQARLEYSKSYYERMQSLFGNGGGSSANERDEAFSKYRSAEASLKAAQSALQKLHGTKAKRLSQAAFAVATQEAEIRRLQDVKTKYTIRAPFDGYVVSRMANVGQWVSRGEDVFQVVQLDPIEVAFKVPQSSVQRLQEAFDSAKTSDETLPARIWIESIGQLIIGEVHKIVPSADLRSRSFPVKIRLKNPTTPTGHLIKAGMLANVSLSIGKVKESLFVEKDALVLGGDQIRVFVATANAEGELSTVRRVNVDVGAAIKNWIEVRGGLAKDDFVVVEGNERLRPGQEVLVTETKNTKLDD